MKTITVMSFKGGAGKTTIAVNLAATAHLAGLKTLLVDTDPLRASVLSLSARTLPGPETRILPSGALFSNGTELARAGYDVRIIDTPAAPRADVAAAANCADLCVIVCRPTFLDMAALLASAEMIKQLGRPGAVVLNQTQPSRGVIEPSSVRRAREAFEMTRGNFFDNIANLVESVTQIGGNWFHADFEATVPRNCDLYLSTQSGEISVEGVEGAIYLGTASGEIEAERISGNVVVQTITGDVEIEGISGQLGLKSTSGDLQLRRGNLTGLYIGTTSGDAEIEAFLHPGKYEMRSVSGDIELKVQREFAAAMSGRTISGDFECDLPYQQVDPRGRKEDDDDDEASDDFTLKVDVPGFRWEYPGGRRGPGTEGGKRRRRNRWEFLIGDPTTASQGATRLRVRTISGDLNIERGDSKPQPTPTTSGQQISEQDFTRPLRADEADTVVRADERQARQQEREARQQEHELRRQTHEQERASREQERASREQERRHREQQRSSEPGSQSREQSRASILQAVENKQISVDEALRLLSQLER